MHRRTFVAFAVAIAGGIALAPAPRALAQDDSLLSRDSVLRDPDIPSLGNPKGDISIVEYFDYQCPFCRKVAPELMGVVRDDGKVRFVLKDWPVLGGVSVYAAKLVLAAKYQDKYEAAHFALISSTVKLNEATVDDLLRKAGVDVDRAKSDIEANKASLDALLARNDGQAKAFGFRGTPGFIIGTFRVPGILKASEFKQAIADARKIAQSK
ncbi:MAG: DsbA family protein [Xanthobacteraceae bacterium]